jgi:hypothetical protein
MQPFPLPGSPLYTLQANLGELLSLGTPQAVLTFINQVPQEHRAQTVRLAVRSANEPSLPNLQAVFGLYPDLLQDLELAIGLFFSEDYTRLQALYDWGWRPTAEIRAAWRQRIDEHIEEDETEEEKNERREQDQRVQAWLASHQ